MHAKIHRQFRYYLLNLQGRQLMYVRRISESSSRSHCSGKAISITYYEFVPIALDIQHAMRMRRVVICGLSGSALLFRISHKQHDFRKESY